MSMESDIVRLREEFATQLEIERNGRLQLEKQLSATVYITQSNYIVTKQFY